MSWGAGFILLYILVVFYVRFRKVPSGLNHRGKVYSIPARDIEFHYDISWWKEGKRNCRQKIFSEVLKMIEKARRFVLIDMFLFSPHLEQENSCDYLPVARRTVELLLRKKAENPDMTLIFITDPVNTAYGNFQSESLNRLREAGIQVIMTDIDKLRDCNYLYGALWLLVFRWFGTGRRGWIPHPMDDVRKKVTIRAFAKALNARANHRKIILADDGDSWSTMVTSSNLHESSCWHSNVALKIKGAIAEDCLETEKAVAAFSKSKIDYEIPPVQEEASSAAVEAQLLTENKIRERILEDLREMGPGAHIAMTSLYLSDRAVMDLLVRSSFRQCRVDIVLDNNTEAFGQPKLGLPNQITAQMLIKKSRGKIRVRMAKSKREQLHAKMLFMSYGDTFILYEGSANFTWRNLGGFTLETTLRAAGSPGDEFALEAKKFFSGLWSGDFSYALEKKPRFYFIKAFLYNFQQLFRLTTY